MDGGQRGLCKHPVSEKREFSYFLLRRFIAFWIQMYYAQTQGAIMLRLKVADYITIKNVFKLQQLSE